MNNDQKLQQEVEQALKWEPLLVNSEIGVIAIDGVITLIGSVDSYAKKSAAEHAAKTVKGVKALIEKIEVTFTTNEKKSDSKLTKWLLGALSFNPLVPEDQIQVNSSSLYKEEFNFNQIFNEKSIYETFLYASFFTKI